MKHFFEFLYSKLPVNLTSFLLTLYFLATSISFGYPSSISIQVSGFVTFSHCFIAYRLSSKPLELGAGQGSTLESTNGKRLGMKDRKEKMIAFILFLLILNELVRYDGSHIKEIISVSIHFRKTKTIDFHYLLDSRY